ncbi:NAD(P)-dependent oxidoreductase [Streptococcus pneumoniae]|nr:NAD(P)-dependent oxidoreductase [Streptococcus pneumoniae]CXG42399.1 dTDP-4-keto-L-rhamnose reductase RmlD [Streptococcus pneumoniae]
MILITGANGQLGTELRYLLDERNEEYPVNFQPKLNVR